MNKILMIDSGRKFFSNHDMKKIIDLMSKYNFNILHWHFSDNEGFRIESKQFPQIVSKQHLKKAEVKQIISYAKLKNISIIPEIDSPGHLAPLLDKMPEFRLNSDNVNLSLSNNALDITNEVAVKNLYLLLDEFLELFKDSTDFHIGADEFIDFDNIKSYPKLYKKTKEKYGEMASGLELYIEYVNELIDYLINRNFIPHVWSDGFYRLNDSNFVKLDKRAIVHYWTKWNKNMAPIQTYI